MSCRLGPAIPCRRLLDVLHLFRITVDDPHCAKLSELSACAYRLSLAFGREAEGAEDAARKLEYFRLFDRCFFAVRVATALELRLWRAPGAAVALAPRPATVPGGLAVRRATGPPRR